MSDDTDFPCADLTVGSNEGAALLAATSAKRAAQEAVSRWGLEEWDVVFSAIKNKYDDALLCTLIEARKSNLRC